MKKSYLLSDGHPNDFGLNYEPIISLVYLDLMGVMFEIQFCAKINAKELPTMYTFEKD